MKLTAVAWLIAGLIAADRASGNGGPFVVKYPNGDPAAKGVLARLDPSLKPARESRLRVVNEDLTISFGRGPFPRAKDQPLPLAAVVAAYTIENPTEEAITVDFGFPILRGIYMSPMSMALRPEARVTVTSKSAESKSVPKHIRATIISNSVIYGLIRQRARETIEQAVAADSGLARRVAALRNAQPDTAVDLPSAREKLATYLTDRLTWNERGAVLMVEYASLDFGKMKSSPIDRAHLVGLWSRDKQARELVTTNLGPLSAIGEQKATQFFAQLADRFDADAAATYAAIFEAWGGDVRERAVDLRTGEVRPRVLATAKAAGTGAQPNRSALARMTGDPTVYARVGYLDPNARITDAEKASCLAVLKHLPVVFTFAPMNLLHYQVDFPAKATQVVTVRYSQYAYNDTGMGAAASYQLAYVLHPASLWDDFGPINLKVHVPKGVTCRASTPLKKTGDATRVHPIKLTGSKPVFLEAYEATLTEARDKTGELFVGLNKAEWDALFKIPQKAATGGDTPKAADAPRPRSAISKSLKTLQASRP